MNEAIPGLKIVELDLYENGNPVSALITDFPKDLALDFLEKKRPRPYKRHAKGMQTNNTYHGVATTACRPKSSHAQTVARM